MFTASNTGIGFSTWSADTSGVTFADGQQYDVNMTGTDNATNFATTTTSFTFDTTAPSSTVTSPTAAQFVNSLSTVTGTASDATAGVASVSIEIQQTGNANGYWTSGSSFAATNGGATAITATTSDSFAHWSADTSGVTFASGQSYTIAVTTTDNASNVDSSTTRQFKFDNTAPVFASAATDHSGTHVDVAFTEASSGLNTSITPAASAFTVDVAGSVRDTVTGVTMTDATHIRLSLTTRAYGEQADHRR